MMADFFKDFSNRPFVFFGTLAFLMTIPLAVTSNSLSMKVLGKWWKKLHSMITIIILLSLAHYFFHKAGKNDFFLAIYCDCSIWHLVCCKKVGLFSSKKKLNLVLLVVGVRGFEPPTSASRTQHST